MNKKVVFLIFLGVLAGLNLGSVRKAEDPIRDTQTNPILYEQKKEEEKDGKKGPLLYHVKNFLRETFFIDLPFWKEKKVSFEKAVTEEAPSSADTAGWWEEQSTDSQEVPSTEAISGPLPGSLPEAEEVRDAETAEQPATVPEAESVPSGKEDDYWW
ncbi:MAG: hypothetical protein WC530_00945 [Candidatus Omnitrophota bacterium]|jgi:hypothetical protein